MGGCSFYIINIAQASCFCKMWVQSRKGSFLMQKKQEGDEQRKMDTPITRAEHEEFCRRMESENQRLADEDKRLGRRVSALEDTTKQMQALTTSVEKLAVNMENMIKIQAEQGNRIDELEQEDEIASLGAGIERLATNVENARKAQEQQGRRLETLEARDGEKWRQVTGYIITAVISIVLGVVFAHIGI